MGLEQRVHCRDSGGRQRVMLGRTGGRYQRRAEQPGSLRRAAGRRSNVVCTGQNGTTCEDWKGREYIDVASQSGEAENQE